MPWCPNLPPGPPSFWAGPRWACACAAGRLSKLDSVLIVRLSRIPLTISYDSISYLFVPPAPDSRRAAAALGLALLGTVSSYAKPVPSNLGNGLDKLVASNLAVSAASATSAKLGKAAGTALNSANFVTVNGKVYTDATTAAVATSAIQDDQGRVLVRVTLNGFATFKDTRKAMKAAAASLTITAKDKTYRGGGVMNAYVDVNDVPALAAANGVAAVILEWKPQHYRINVKEALASTTPAATVGEVIAKIGTTFDQGVTQHGIDQINKFYNAGATLDLEGQGMQIGCISNSFAANTGRSREHRRDQRRPARLGQRGQHDPRVRVAG